MAIIPLNSAWYEDKKIGWPSVGPAPDDNSICTLPLALHGFLPVMSSIAEGHQSIQFHSV